MVAFTKAGRYQIVSEIGRGSMGIVYKGFDPVIGRNGAIKCIKTEGLSSAEYQEHKARFVGEARAAGVLGHPNIVTIHDFGEEEGTLYLAMELLSGTTLQQMLEDQGVLPVEMILQIFDQVGSALDRAHQHGVIHRDIKPGNIMVLDDGLVKVTDFGIAKLLLSASMTQAGSTLGSPSYMSPEQIKGLPIDGRSDIFSLGIVLYECLTGAKPFPGQNVSTIAYKIVNEEPANPLENDVSIHPGLYRVMSKALAKQPQDRYQTGRELAEELKNYRNLDVPSWASCTIDADQCPVGIQPVVLVSALKTNEPNTQSPSATMITCQQGPHHAPASLVPSFTDLRAIGDRRTRQIGSAISATSSPARATGLVADADVSHRMTDCRVMSQIAVTTPAQVAAQPWLRTPAAPVNTRPNPRSRLCRSESYRGVYLRIGVIPLAIFAMVAATAAHYPRGARRRTAGISQAVAHSTQQESNELQKSVASAGESRRSSQRFSPQRPIDLSSASPATAPNPAPGPKDVKRDATEKREHDSRRHFKGAAKVTSTEFKPMVPQISLLDSSVPDPPILMLPPQTDRSSLKWNTDPPPYVPQKGKKHRSFKQLFVGSK